MISRKVMLVHPNQNHIKWIRNYLVRSAKFYNFDIGQINSDVDNMFHKYPRCDRGIIVSSTNEGIPDSSLLASNLKLTNNDILIPDFVPPLDLTERRPDWKHVFELYEKKLNLKEDDPIVIGGFALLDCISGIANEGIKKGYSVYVDELMTEYFRLHYRLRMAGEKPISPTLYLIKDMDAIMSKRKNKIGNL